MDSARKKELREQYKLMKPRMGVFIVRAGEAKKCYVQGTQDLRGVMNGARVRLENGFHPNKGLQKAWNELGADAFAMEILENLEYDKDESKTDYSEDLALMQMDWEEKMREQGFEICQK
jgi:hypothetical protein